jgi:hypothetical protein
MTNRICSQNLAVMQWDILYISTVEPFSVGIFFGLTESSFTFFQWQLNFYLKLFVSIQYISGEKVSILVGHSIGYSKQKVCMYMYPIPNGLRDRAVSLYSTLYTVQTSNTPCPHTSCKVH